MVFKYDFSKNSDKLFNNKKGKKPQNNNTCFWLSVLQKEK